MPDVAAFLKRIDHGDMNQGEPPCPQAHVLQAAPTFIYLYNQDTRSVEIAGASLAVLMGYGTDEIAGTDMDVLLYLCHPEDKVRVQAHFAALRNIEEGAALLVEYRLRHKSGEWVWMQSNDTVLETAGDGAVRRHVGAIADITLQKTALDREMRNFQATRLANEELRSFAYAVSHDMAAPANTLSLLLSELREDHEGSLDGDALNLIDLGQQTVERMKTLIEEVLNYTRLVDKQVSEDTVALNPLIDKVLWDMRHCIEAAHATIDIGRLPSVIGNAPLLRTLFVNLVSNAIKFRRADVNPEISIRETTDERSTMISISVTDNGIGLPIDKSERIFGMFNRLHTRDVYPGSGLGLSLCRRIAVNHGGDIVVDSLEDVGATFTVLLRPA